MPTTLALLMSVGPLPYLVLPCHMPGAVVAVIFVAWTSSPSQYERWQRAIAWEQ